MKRITTVVVGETKYEIVKNHQGYWAINHKYIGKDGKANREINGVNGWLSKTREEVIKRALFAAKVDEFRRLNPNHTKDELGDYMLSIVGERV